MSKFWPRHRGAELGVSTDIFGNYDVPYGRESRVTRRKQCNVWCRTISIRSDLSTERRTSTTWRRRRKKRFTQTCRNTDWCTCLKEMYFYDERRQVLSLPVAGGSAWGVRFFSIVFKLFFVQNYLGLYGKLSFPAFLF